MARKKILQNDDPVESPDSNGIDTIQISENVIAAVVRKYTLSVPGIARLAGQSLVGGLADIFGKRINDKSIIVELDDDKVNLTVHVIIKFGEHVPSVATNIQTVCRKYVEELTGQLVGKIDVVVQNLESEDDPKEEEEDDVLEESAADE
jgi:uncharacterized alkaline shock family protein YloU